VSWYGAVGCCDADYSGVNGNGSRISVLIGEVDRRRSDPLFERIERIDVSERRRSCIQEEDGVPGGGSMIGCCAIFR
jgi:hypothetical protein